MLRQANGHRGQVTVEMAILFAFVVVALVVMSIYLQRAAQGGMKSNSDSLGSQFSATSAFSSSSTSNTVETPATVTSNQTSGYSQTY